jgi:hypothetical protein
MDLPLQQTILSQLTYVNLTHGLRAPDTSFLRLDVVIECTGVLQKTWQVTCENADRARTFRRGRRKLQHP